jgi:hypothetical protein
MHLKPMLAALALSFAAAAPAPAQAPSKTDAAKEKARIQALQAQVRSYRCITKGGRKYYGATVPQQCTGELVEALSSQGTVLFRIEPPLTAEQRAAQAAEAEKAAAAEEAKRDAEAAARVQARRDQALLQTYAGEKDIEMVRQRALADNRAAAAQVEARIAQLKQRQDKLAKEALKYKAGAAPPPHQFEQDVRAVAYDLSLQEQLLESRRKEASAINARYDLEIRKYRELTGGAKAARK